MTITSDLFEAFLRCPTKCYLRAEGAPPSGNVFTEWARREDESYRVEAATCFMNRHQPVATGGEPLDRSDFLSANWRCAADSTTRSQHLESRFHAIERISSQATPLPVQFVPIRFVRAKRPNSVDKLMLAF